MPRIAQIKPPVARIKHTEQHRDEHILTIVARDFSVEAGDGSTKIIGLTQQH